MAKAHARQGTRDNGGEGYCLDWGFKSSLRDTGPSLKGLSTAAESEFLSVKHVTGLSIVMRVKRDRTET